MYLALWPPRTAAALRSYLDGAWRLEKTMKYSAGGVTGTFSGGATFTPLQHETRDLLTYIEEGQAVLGPERATFTARKLLLWDFSDPMAAVFFDEATERSPAAIWEGARFFHHIDLEGDGPSSFIHHCTPDLYEGAFALGGPDRFELTWHISGPKKDGVIHNTFIRCSEGAAPA
uniref:DUF6314 domain-containing protein n=1 Tax=Haptolina ericina TaxID=156174 RepID=A0A7S3FEY7_9EUKA